VDSTIATLKARLAEHGLLIRSVFHIGVDDPLQPVNTASPDKAGPVATIVLVGNAGSSIWHAFSQSSEFNDGRPDPLDRWSNRIGLALAESLGAKVMFPFGGPPFHPFLSWAKRGEVSFESPLGLSLHPEYGLWHAYRFALGFGDYLDIEGGGSGHQVKVDSASPCLSCKSDRCEELPCLVSCPVGAFTTSGYEVMDCARFLDQNPNHECNLKGCRARRACPIGQHYHYDEQHAQFHMHQFVINHIDSDS